MNYIISFRLIALAWIFALCCSCSEGEQPGYFMTFLHDGAEVAYRDPTTLSAVFTLADGQYIGVVTGSSSASAMVLKVYDDQAISERLYREFAPVGVVYRGSLIAYESGGKTYTQGALVPDIRIRVTELTNEYVRGAFAGTLKTEGQPDIVISKGEFFVRRVEL